MNSSEKNDSGMSSELQENINLLRQIDFFSSLRLEALKVLAYLCDRESFEPEEELITKNEDGGRAFYILSGRARLERQDESGLQVLREYEKETLLGGLILLGEMHSLFSVRAVEKTTCLVLTREKFKRVVEQFPEMIPKVLKGVVTSVRDWEKEFLTLGIEGKGLGVSML
jgi:CRP/FNR family cyclic AMP-dependent transcriptional regulator